MPIETRILIDLALVLAILALLAWAIVGTPEDDDG